ncbi:MAG: hypothetical protein HOM11_01595 [Methylococcales bacterium]|jgi:hypothetical protein|nr:hypothetical protein [Methylococcales bacterium]
MKAKLFALFNSSLILLSYSVTTLADGNSIDKVYHPYVVETEVEVEWRTLFQNDNDDTLDDQQVHRLGVGYGVTESLFAEFYLIGGRSPSDDFDIEAVEIELLWQLTEQGEYDYDWGLLFELEREIDNQVWEFSTGLLIEKEWGHWVGAANLLVEYEWGNDIEDEIETAASFQLRYRYNAAFEPAVEFYQSEKTTGIGPVAMGNIRLGIAQKLHWEFGVIFGLKSETPNQTIKASLEYEF